AGGLVVALVTGLRRSRLRVRRAGDGCRSGDRNERDDKDTQDLLHGGVPFRGRRVTGIRWHGSSDTTAGFQVPRLCPKLRVHRNPRTGARWQAFDQVILGSYGYLPGGWAGGWAGAAAGAAGGGGAFMKFWTVLSIIAICSLASFLSAWSACMVRN